MTRKLSLVFALLLVSALPVLAQQTAPAYYRFGCYKVPPGKGAEFTQFLGTMRKVVQAEADSGEFTGAYLLRTIYPEGTESRCDYISLSSYAGVPPAPQGSEHLRAMLKKAGVAMTVDEFQAKRSELQQTVSVELWQVVGFAGEIQSGDYIYMNFMKSHQLADYAAFERDMWQPAAKLLVDDGTFHAWFAMTADLPEGVGLPYQLVSADIFQTWDKAMAGEDTAGAFRKAHPDADFAAIEAKLVQMRDLDRRYFLAVQDVVLPSVAARP